MQQFVHVENLPSWLDPVPRMTPRIVSPSRRASSKFFRSMTQIPSPRAYPLARSSNLMLIRTCDMRILGAIQWLLTCNSGHQEIESPIETGPRVHQVIASTARPLLSSSCSHQYEWTGSQGAWRPYCWSKQCPERPKGHGGHRNEKAGLPAS